MCKVLQMVTVIRSKEKKPKRVTCSTCNTSFWLVVHIHIHLSIPCDILTC
ncbi:hypothetical protein ANCCEY_10995 [Ancylostoma ceylanicum]|uniref:C2H2-type domain-containing protein n=1 Tax=Ancylostoma ceylanicum TaxID=53326 RepID=A0A0D6LDE9_9BILA|nr:hypothetical protein ANCCEY_10995 [Ancylostoma ceylanicum]